MTSKWIKEIQEVLNENQKDHEITLYTELEKILEIVDSLLRQAMLDTDNEFLHDEIKKETEKV